LGLFRCELYLWLSSEGEAMNETVMANSFEPVKHANLAEALAAAQAEFTDIPKDREAHVRGKSKSGVDYEYTYKYADFSDVLKVIRPILSRHGISFTQPIRRKEIKAYLVTVLKFGSEVLESDGLPIPDMMAPQELGSLLTYWRRYDFCSLVGVQPDEDEDGRRAAMGASAGKGARARNEAKIEKQSSEGRASERDVRAFWAAVNSTGTKPKQIKEFLGKHGYGSVEEIPAAEMQAAIQWALSGAQPIGLISKCLTHGEYPGEGNCPKCEAA
jgi:ERF superfamily